MSVTQCPATVSSTVSNCRSVRVFFEIRAICLAKLLIFRRMTSRQCPVGLLYLTQKLTMEINLEPSWKAVLADEFTKPYFSELVQFVKEEYTTAGLKCYPPGRQIFAAFDHCPFDKVKVVILGQD